MDKNKEIKINILVNNISWNIEFVDEFDDNLLMDDGYHHCGITNYKTKTVYINKNLIQSVLLDTLIHELTHVYIESYGLLQIEWNDEIVADFMSHNGISIFKLVEEVVEKINKSMQSDTAIQKVKDELERVGKELSK